MISSVQLSWTLSIVFGVVCGWSLFRCLQPNVAARQPTIADRVSYFAHFVMSAAMIAMIWPWGMGLPLWPQTVVFVLATVWFLALAAAGSRIASCARDIEAQGRWHNLQHAVLMTAMVWMLAMMPLVPTSSPSEGSGHAHHGGASASTSSSVDVDIPVAITMISLLLALYCVFLALRWISSGVDAGRAGLNSQGDAGIWLRAAGLDAAHHGAMGLGMATMLWALF